MWDEYYSLKTSAWSSFSANVTGRKPVEVYICLLSMNENDQDSVVNKLPTLSEHLCAWRSSAELSVEKIAAELSVRPQIILALEEGDYSIFPAHVYASGCLKRMIEHFSIARGDVLLDVLRTEWEEKRGAPNTSVLALPKSRREKWYITPRRLFGSLGAVALVLFAWFLASQLMGFTGAPSLHIDEPHSDAIIEMPTIHVRGTTEKESQLTVNGREITMNENGVFDQEIQLVPGVNTLQFVAQNRFGKTSQETRYVVVR